MVLRISQWASKACIVVILVFACYKMGRAYDKRGDGFTLEKMTSHLIFNPSWESQIDVTQKEKAAAILSQPFYYLGRGFQCYAFVSQDGQYVLKFFRHQRLRISDWYARFPLPECLNARREKKIRDKNRRMEKLFTSCKLGFEKIPEETGLVYVHLNKTADFKQKVVIYDLLHNRYELNIDDYEFMVQKKAEHLIPVFQQLLAAGRIEDAKRRLDQIFDLIVLCAEKGVGDMDGALISKNNAGFLENRAIYIDTGMLVQTEYVKTKEWLIKDLARLWRLEDWFKKNSLELAVYLNERKEHVIANYKNVN